MNATSMVCHLLHSIDTPPSKHGGAEVNANMDSSDHPGAGEVAAVVTFKLLVGLENGVLQEGT